MQLSRLNLKALELFERAAQSGSLQAVSAETGLSVSTISHHLKGLEVEAGTPLLDHRRRPMVLTPAGTVFLRRVQPALQLIRQGQVEVTAGELSALQRLRLGMIDDFDIEIAPELTRMLAAASPDCAFRHMTRPSHENLALLRGRQLDIAVATRPADGPPEGVEIPLVRDPFVMAVPRGAQVDDGAFLDGTSGLPFLRYAKDQTIGRLIEAQLRRLRVTLPNRFEIDSNTALMGMVADGSGWAITTPTSWMRLPRYHGAIRLIPFAGREFGRTIAVYAAEPALEGLAGQIATSLRPLIDRRVIRPACAAEPWLAEGFRLA